MAGCMPSPSLAQDCSWGCSCAGVSRTRRSLLPRDEMERRADTRFEVARVAVRLGVGHAPRAVCPVAGVICRGCRRRSTPLVGAWSRDRDWLHSSRRFAIYHWRRLARGGGRHRDVLRHRQSARPRGLKVPGATQRPCQSDVLDAFRWRAPMVTDATRACELLVGLPDVTHHEAAVMRTRRERRRGVQLAGALPALPLSRSADL